MLRNSLPTPISPYPIIESIAPRLPESCGGTYRTRISTPAESRHVSRSGGERSTNVTPTTVEILPHGAATRRGVEWHGMGVEFVQAARPDRVEYSFRSTAHLLVAYEHGVRRDGETFVEGAPRSTLRNVARKLTFAPSGHEYREWHQPRTPMGMMYFHFDPDKLEIDSETNMADFALAPRLFFEDTTIWSTAAKLTSALRCPSLEKENHLYFEALGVVLVHELLRLGLGSARAEALVRGGLAAWQQRLVTAYIEEHLSEQISLATLAQLARLSPYYFCRAFKQSLGVPPHRFHTMKRIEHAKALLAGRKHSVTEIGLTVGYSETSSFTAAFRKITGQTPSSYHRSVT
jgi:AraC family transcriptional regulator